MQSSKERLRETGAFFDGATAVYLPSRRTGRTSFGPLWPVFARWGRACISGREKEGHKRKGKGAISIDKEGKRIDWNAIRAEYIGGGISQRKLAEKHGVSTGALLQRANAEGWAKSRENAKNKAITKAEQKAADIASDNATIAANIQRQGLLILQRLFEDYAQHTCTERRESGDGVTEVKRLRDLTAAYKDLTEDITKVGEDKNAPVYELLKRLDNECGI